MKKEISFSKGIDGTEIAKGFKLADEKRIESAQNAIDREYAECEIKYCEARIKTLQADISEKEAAIRAAKERLAVINGK